MESHRLPPWAVVGVLCWAGCYTSLLAHPERPVSDSEVRLSTYAGIEVRLRQEVAQWQGVPYRLGGRHMRGIDCSAFVQNVLVGLFGLYLPRSTAEQARFGRRIERDELLPGDLVFFRIGRRTRHVGIYLGQGEFAHASQSQGVVVSRLDDPYWARRYWMARRVLEVQPAPVD
jgi:cell wall-associated NlpC family hydrolase